MENSADKIGNNQDISTLILLRLPTKSLLKFKCVSKQWLCIISDPQFCVSHTCYHQRNGFLEPTALLLKVNHRRSAALEVVPLKHSNEVPLFNHYVNAPNIDMLQSCNGLFLCESIDGDNVSRYFICNPTTKKFKMISFPRKQVKGREFYVNLAFDPLKSPHYKIISIRQVSELSYKLSYRLTYKFEMDIYWSKTDSWTVSVISFEVDAFQRIIFEEPIFCNGMIHWKCYGKKSRYFDVDKKCLQEMPMPTRRNPRFEFYRYFGEAKGTLYLAFTYHDSMFLEVDVNEMASDYSNWFLKHRLNLGDVLKAFSDLKLGCLDYCPGFSGVCFIRSEKGEEPKFVVWADGIIIFYDFNDGRWEKLYDPVVKIGSRNLDFFGHLHAQRFLAYKYFENLSCI